ncbi:MAG: UDP-N-acetylglucosamine 2-epimerase (non-hydrolyzing) [Longimicrobiales bacterium]
MTVSTGLPRVLVVMGTRPEAIKLAPVMRALRARPELQTRLALTGQHSDLVDQVLQVFGIVPDWDLAIMREGQDLYDVAHGCLDGLRRVADQYKPDVIVVQGDTASVFFGALVAFFQRARVAHVEAGLRSGDKWQPYPEEIFRRMTGVITDFHFAPTAGARANLVREGTPADTVFVTGNTVVDALLAIAGADRPVTDDALRSAIGSGRRLVLVTAHRRESFGAPIREAFGALREIADRYPDTVLVYPVHPNPNVRGPADEVLSGHDRILLTTPLDYFDLVHALRHATLAITDSGGIQEEAPSFGTPTLVLREVTERPEGVEAGVAVLVGTDRNRILTAAAGVLDAGADRAEGSRFNPYGDGNAAARIADVLAHALAAAPRQTADLP